MRGLSILLVCLLAATLPLRAQSDGCNTPLKPSAQTRYEQALKAYEAGHYVTCHEELRKLAAKNPKSADIQFYLGLCAVKRDNNPAAIRRYFTKLATLCPDYPDARAHLYLGIIYYSDDRFDEAVVELNRFFEIANSHSNPAYDAVYAEASNYLHWSQFLADAQRNQAPFNPHAMSGVSSSDREMMPYLTHNGNTMYYLRETALGGGYGSFYAPSHAKKVWQLFSSQRRDTAFTAGEALPPPFNQYDGEGSVTVTADGRELYYSVMRMGPRGYSNVDIYQSHRRDDGSWSEVSSVGNNINGEGTWESQPSVTADGQWLYFASNRKGGYGGTDIWRCHRNADSTWGRPENLGPAVNTALNEKCPFIHADGKTLYFASNGWQGFGGYDLYFIRVGDTYLQCPTNMGLPINSERDDICLGVTADGSTGYYAQNDIYRFELYPAARPEAMRYVRAHIVDEQGQPLPAHLTVQRAEADATRYGCDRSGTAALILSMKQNNVVVAQCDGYMPQVATFSATAVRRGIDSTQLTFRLRPVKVGDHYPIAQPIDAYVDLLLAHPNMHICIEAPHAADAKAVYDQFVGRKLRKERLSWRGGTDIETLRITITQD